MGLVNILDISVANLIAAGEVVERPCNAVKELVENAIDAGATAVTVEIRRGGVAFLRVTDNGCGMSGEDAVVAIRRHATSKIKAASDLAAIGTLGFRGEALAAITAVSQYRIMTKRPADTEGTLVSGAYGKTEEVTPTGCPDGTTVICERLFATTPARLKFLKSDASEASAVAQMLEKLAVSRPEIAFRFISDGKLKFSTAGDGVLKNAVYSVYGSAFSADMLAVQGGSRGIRVEGYISSPELVRGNRGMQHFFVNERSVRSKTLTASLEAAFASYLPPSKYPSCVLNIIIPLSLVDVNIHPAKLEVKFSEEKAVFDAVYSAVRGTLVSRVSRPVLDLTEKTIRMEGNLSMEAEKLPKGEQTTLDAIFVKAAEKGARAEAASAENNEKKDLPHEPTPVSAPSAVSSQAVSVGGAEEDQKEKPTAQSVPKTEMPTDSEPKKTAPSVPEIKAEVRHEKNNTLSWDDDDISVDVPVLSESPIRRVGLRAETKPDALDRYSRIFGTSVKESESIPAIVPSASKAVPDGKEASPKAPAPAALAEETPVIDLGDTDAKIEGEAAKPVPPYRIVGEVFASYVILEVEDKMLLVDKHAAHERINFERLRANMKQTVRHTQLLLTPDILPMTADELSACREYRAELSEIGFDFSISDREVQISGVPQDFTRTEALALFSSLITQTVENGGSISADKLAVFEQALYQSSCKSAVKAGRVYDTAHLRWICDNLLRYDCIKFCPHGRPVAFELSKKELDSRFGRT